MTGCITLRGEVLERGDIIIKREPTNLKDPNIEASSDGCIFS